MKIIKTIIVWIASWIISALILFPCVFPCVFLSILSGFKIDYHHKFHLWWGIEVLDKL